MSYAGHTVTLTLQGDGYQYEMYPVQEADTTQRKEAFSVAPPGLPARDNILLGISGMQSDITLEFAIWDDGTDRANGTAPNDSVLDGEVVTLQEQVHWLKGYIQDETFASSWTLEDSQGYFVDFDDGSTGIEVFVEEIDYPTLSQDNERWKPARMGLREGGSI